MSCVAFDFRDPSSVLIIQLILLAIHIGVILWNSKRELVKLRELKDMLESFFARNFKNEQIIPPAGYQYQQQQPIFQQQQPMQQQPNNNFFRGPNV